MPVHFAPMTSAAISAGLATLAALSLLASCGGATSGAPAATSAATSQTQSQDSVADASAGADAASQGGPQASGAPDASSEAEASPKGVHTHDPGRGLADIKAIIVAHRDEARACYDHALATHPGIEGDLVVQWTIGPKGDVTQTSLDTSRSQIAEPGVVACISSIIKKIQFAPSPGGFETKASYPFNFHPRHAAGQ
jgi:hypothetical protein